MDLLRRRNLLIKNNDNMIFFDFLKGDFKAYIDTGIILNGDYEIELECMRANIGGANEAAVISTWLSNTLGWSLFFTSGKALDFYADGHHLSGAIDDFTKSVVKIRRYSNQIIYYLNGSELYNFSAPEDSNTTVKILRRGDRNNPSFAAIGKVTIKDLVSQELIADYYPAVIDGVAGLYDGVSGSFLSPVSTGSFFVGNNA